MQFAKTVNDFLGEHMTYGEKMHQDSECVPELLRLGEAARYLRISTSTLWRLGERDPLFPKKIYIGIRICYLRKSELDQWVEKINSNSQ